MSYSSVAAAAEEIVRSTGGNIVLGMPLGMGKPNPLVNALYRMACADSSISLTILTALSLTRPRASGELQQRFLAPFIERVYADYEELDYLHAARAHTLPDNICVNEFFVQPASELSNPYTQQNYINSNYTHAARDMNNRGVNVIAQTIASRNVNGEQQFSLSCNPEVLLDALPRLLQRRESGETVLVVAQIHPDMPFMENTAEVPAALFDMIIDDPAYSSRLISTPNMPVSMTEHFIGLGASALLKDGGTLQIGIGALGDAVASATLLRHTDNSSYRGLLDETGLTPDSFSVLAADGGADTFEQGLYGCSEMFTYGLFRLMEGGVIKRHVTDAQGRSICMHGGFFLGPNAFYESLRQMSPEQHSSIDMTHISFVNSLYGQEELKRQHRVEARFVNTAFTVTLMGAGVADQLDDGRILSGVGGQYNFVAQAHELEGARSVLLVRATREKDGKVSSNIVWNYAHTTIPRHLRDIVVTEYGVADLRSKTDAEVIAAMLNICDSRFQQELMETAKEHGKLAQDHQIPERFQNNNPQKLREIYLQHHRAGHFPDFPLGSDFTYVEEMLLPALSWLGAHMKTSAIAELARVSVISDATAEHYQPHLARMGCDKPTTIRDRLYRQLLLMALCAVDKTEQ
ncbi:acetyl-CoA hydrolase/transferase family protein [Halieaceae bacterium IMCC14734]|uniref:Acetyl-CoA hydrolase/transferase family protein n=1 Tax=Candidatus Litorirhabdus singularis TaxID=2518993 RepID=A0ABT3TLE3_9GAMM|nr:acetyl-CoA hydrolase/transferase C-terminal domain-containing protein [Candidatus Litorirhabdus singularis]MCX2983076.1 acetyl-CoA hydrolase/transferase family protein [Candidatus Litorirhabdus singularis]